MSILQIPSPLSPINDPLLEKHGVRLLLKRDDLIHPHISGNKWRKLKYNVQAAKEQGQTQILTFGGAYSNHITATAATGQILGIKTIGVIRGDEFVTQNKPLNKSLEFAKQSGMYLRFVSRTAFRQKHDPHFLAQLRDQFGDFYPIPEGGSNRQGVLGCMDILPEIKTHYDCLCCACGTGTTFAGLVASLPQSNNPQAKIMGFPALKGGQFLEKDINNLVSQVQDLQQQKENTSLSISPYILQTDYHFGGYARTRPELLQFIRNFYTKHRIKLDYVYTGKLLYGIFDLIQQDYFPKGSTIIAIHTGGVQNASVDD